MKNRVKSYFNNKKGMTLVEVLTAMALISLMIFCFAPLFLTYLNSIVIAGDKIEEINIQSGTMQTVIGLADSLDSSKYSTELTEVPLSLQASVGTPLSRKGTAGTISATKSATLGNELDNFKGDLLFSNADNPNNSYITANGHSTAAGLSYYPSSVTDDFHIATITLIADGGIKFLGDLGYDDFEVTVSNVGKLGQSDYQIRKIDDEMAILEFYGGGKVCFENSPLVIKYRGHKCVIEIDAPMMIMVGEQAPDKEYYYYVSRGEFDSNNNLLIHRRKMTGTDPSTGETINLTSAMNDVEWVPASSSDKSGLAVGQEEYGYYVMCGDNGQIRRFWREPDKFENGEMKYGSYYWGGDTTYYTDIMLDAVAGNQYFNGTKKKSTTVAYEFSARRDQANGKGYNLGAIHLFAGGTKYLQCNNIWTVTALDNATKNNYFYASDGKVFHLQGKKGSAYNKTPQIPYSTVSKWSTNNKYTYNSIEYYLENEGNLNSRSTYKNGHEAMTWLKGNSEGYYALYGLNKDSTIPITLTSADAIVMTDKITSSTGYYGDVRANSYELALETTGTNLSYPISSYTLYCGYIPAAMDAWSVESSTSTSMEDAVVAQDGGTFNNVKPENGLTRATANFGGSGIEQYAKWRGTFGIEPYLTSGTSFITKEEAQMAYSKEKATNLLGIQWDYPRIYVYYYPYTNLKYALSGRVYDSSSKLGDLLKNRAYSTFDGKQQYITSGQVVDVTAAYLSHPFAVHIAANPSDDQGYDMGNDKKNHVHYWNNRRETVTYLDCASTFVPGVDAQNNPIDIPVSLMVGYVMGGLVERADKDMFVNTMMNNGIVMIRSGAADIGQQNTTNNKTEEYYAKDSTGYELSTESNVFHQFYFLNSRTNVSDKPESGDHIGNLYGAHYWQNNRHISLVSTNGGEPGTNYNYLRCHPLSNTKVNCVTWGASWAGNPVAMWGTENGTLLSWKCEINDDDNDGLVTNPANCSCQNNKWYNQVAPHKKDEHAENFNDRAVCAEFQSYKWIDTVKGKTFSVKDADYKETVGSNGVGFTIGNATFTEFYDSCSRSRGASLSEYGFISTLDSVNDVACSNDVWVAVGDQSGKAPKDYCGNKHGKDLSGETIEAFTGDGRAASYVNVCYWIDTNADAEHRQNSTNRNYQWKAVKISDDTDCNIVQISCLNGLWIAVGYRDTKDNGEYDNGEQACIFWTYDPRRACDEDGGWSDAVEIYDGKDPLKNGLEKMGAINSCATRNE